MITFTRKAKIALETLQPKDRKRVENAIRTVDRDPENSAGPRQVRKLNLPGNVYIARAGRMLQVIFELSDETAQILDIVRSDRLERFHQALAS